MEKNNFTANELLGFWDFMVSNTRAYNARERWIKMSEDDRLINHNNSYELYSVSPSLRDIEDYKKTLPK